MGMSVEKEGGLIAIQQPVEGLKAGMGQVMAGNHVPSRGVGEEQIKAFFEVELWGQAHGPEAHLPLGVLVCALPVSHGPAQPHDAQPLILIIEPIHADTAQRRVFCIVLVVVAVDIEHRTVGKGGKKREVLRLHIPAGENQIDPVQLLRGEVVPEIGGFLVGYGKYSHVFPPMPWTRISSLARSVNSSTGGMQPST